MTRFDRFTTSTTGTLEDLTEEMEVACPVHDYCSSAEPAAVDLWSSGLEWSKWRGQVEEMAISCKFGLELFASKLVI